MDRCSRCLGNEIYVEYHDTERGVPLHDEKKHFEILVLETQQAGLNWLTILKCRERYREVLDDFDVEKIAKYDEKKIKELLQDSRIIRNEKKIRSIVNNAKCFLKIQSEFGSFDKYIWGWTNGQIIVNNISDEKNSIISSPLSDKIAKDMKSRGFNFIGSIMVYSWLQAIGIINDHFSYCFRFQELKNNEKNKTFGINK